MLAFDRAVARASRRRTPTRCSTSSTGTGDGRRSAARSTSSSPGTGVFVARGHAVARSTTADGARAPLRARPTRAAAATARRTPSSTSRARSAAARPRRGSSRSLATPEVGCASVTQFVGYIPRGRAPDHFHRYDEVVYVLEGEGALHIGGESGAAARRARASTCRRGSSTASRTRARRDAGARRLPPGRLARRGLLPRRHAPPSRPRMTDAADRAHRRGRLGGERRPRRGLDLPPARGAFSELAFSLPTRIGRPEGKTSPEELLAAAHGGCITMSLAGELTGSGHPAGPARRRRAGS